MPRGTAVGCWQGLWFRKLSQAELGTLAKRGTPIYFPRYSTIIREGNVGQFFYLLLEGQVCTARVTARHSTSQHVSARCAPRV